MAAIGCGGDRCEAVDAVAPRTSTTLEGSARAIVAALYDAHHAAIRGLAQRLTGDADAAEDLVQDVFVALPRLIKHHRGQGSLRSFLLGIAVNHARHHVRAAARRRKAGERYAHEPRVEHASSPDRAIELRAMAERLQRALDALPLKHRIAFVLCEIERVDQGDAARVVGVPAATLRTRLMHAKRKLRATFEEGA